MSKVSVIIPLYNQGHFVVDAIDSLLAQTLTDWEAIIVNDGSTDDSSIVAEGLCGRDQRIKLFHRVNGGLSAARNTGLDHASGEYIALLDSDDFFLPSYLETMVTALADPEMSLSWCRFQETDQNLQPKKPFKLDSKLKLSEEINLTLLSKNPSLRLVWDNPLVPCCQVWRADAIQRLRFNESLKSNEDWDILCRLEQSGGKFSFVNYIMSYYRRHGDSLNRNSRRMIETRFACGLGNYVAGDDDQLKRLACLALVMSSSILEVGDPLLELIPGDASSDIESFEQALGSAETNAITTLWCGGAARSARPPEGSRADLVIRHVRLRLFRKPMAWKFGFQRVTERFEDSLKEKFTGFSGF
jgi:glycosyltransferase involved in cell wall biosynthesis